MNNGTTRFGEELIIGIDAGRPEQKKNNLSIEEKLLLFQMEQERELGLDPPSRNQWFDPVPRQFFARDKSSTTILFDGLTIAHFKQANPLQTSRHVAACTEANFIYSLRRLSGQEK